MTERAIVFPCAGEQLLGILHETPGQDGETGVVIVVGGPQYRVGSHRQFVVIARALAAAGFSTFRFDYRGMGDSTGSVRTFDAVNEDIRAAIDCMQAQLPRLSRFVVFGLCDAAAAALIYCASDSRVRALMLENPWVRTTETQAQTYLRHYYLRRLVQKTFWKKVLTGRFEAIGSVTSLTRTLAAAGGGSGASQRSFIDRMLSGLRAFRGPVLIVLSGRDLTAREFEDLCRDVPAWRRATRHPGVDWVRIDDADHTFSDRQGLDESICAMLSWLGRTASA